MDERVRLENRWYEFERQLEMIHECRVVPVDPALLESALLAEQDAIEFAINELDRFE